MHKECLDNSFEAEWAGDGKVKFLGAEWEVAPENVPEGVSEGDRLLAEVEFRDMDLLDESDEGTVSGQVSFILYKGNHYFLTVKTEDGDKVYVQTDDVWDKNDLVGINVRPENIRLKKAEGEAR